MSTVREYFDQHPHTAFSVSPEIAEDGLKVEVVISCNHDFEAGVKYLRIYIAACKDPGAVFFFIMARISEFWEAEAGLEISLGIAGGTENVTSSSLPFSGRVILYSASAIDAERSRALVEQAKTQGLSLIVRDSTYAALRIKYDKPIAFLSHDSGDKEVFVRPLAQCLAKMLCPIWYDEFTLVPGQSLRASIESGLREVQKCVVVLSPNFLKNEGWGKREFETVYQREIIEGGRVMIPIWLGVTKHDIYDYSPYLLDTLAIDGGLGVEEVARKLVAALNYRPPSVGAQML